MSSRRRTACSRTAGVGSPIRRPSARSTRRSSMRDRIRFRLAVLRVFPYGGKLLIPATLIQLWGALAPVAFIVATSAIVGRVPAAIEHGVGSPEWHALRNVLLLAGV